jgi:hypothetical protein
MGSWPNLKAMGKSPVFQQGVCLAGQFSDAFQFEPFTQKKIRQV